MRLRVKPSASVMSDATDQPLHRQRLRHVPPRQLAGVASNVGVPDSVSAVPMMQCRDRRCWCRRLVGSDRDAACAGIIDTTLPEACQSSDKLIDLEALTAPNYVALM